MKIQKILDLLNKASDSKLATKNGTLSMINQTQIMMQEMNLFITKKYWILTVVITTMLTFY